MFQQFLVVQILVSLISIGMGIKYISYNWNYNKEQQYRFVVVGYTVFMVSLQISVSAFVTASLFWGTETALISTIEYFTDARGSLVKPKGYTQVTQLSSDLEP